MADHGDNAGSWRQPAGPGQFVHLGHCLAPQCRRERRPADVIAVQCATPCPVKDPTQDLRAERSRRAAVSPRNDGGFAGVRRRGATLCHDRTMLSCPGTPTDRDRRACHRRPHPVTDRAARCGKVGNFRSESENADEDVLGLGAGPHDVELCLMQPLDPKRPGGMCECAAGRHICFSSIPRATTRCQDEVRAC